MRIAFYFEPRDLWVGLYWTRKPTLVFRKTDPKSRLAAGRFEERLHLYFCFFPTLVLKVVFA